MIPKVIYYCWFGRKPLPLSARKNIESWKKFFPDYEIIEWNENNFDVNLITYTRVAYAQKKYAFVSDFARYWILYNYGGLYFDTDVEVIKSFEDIIANGPFLGIEKSTSGIFVNPGLGMGAKVGMDFYKKIVDFYTALPQNSKSKPYLVEKTTEFLVKDGFKLEDKLQKVDEIFIYPNDFFNPLDDYTGKITITPNTHSIHYYAKSWIKGYSPVRNFLTRKYHSFIKIIKIY